MEPSILLSNIRSLRGGLNQSELRNLNERLLLSMIQRYSEIPRSELAKISGLSPQTASVIIRKLETEGLLMPGKPTKGKVGKPSTPMTLNPDGVFSIGLKIGRRNTELILMDFVGKIRNRKLIKYPYPLPHEIFQFMETNMDALISVLGPAERDRILGIGVALPHDLWRWHELLGAAPEKFQAWQKFDFQAEIRRITDLKTSFVNDATAACRAEHVYGRGKEFRDYAYFYIGTFIGGGVVLNHAVYEGNLGNAGAFGALRTIGSDGKETTLIETASIYGLERSLAGTGIEPDRLWGENKDWSGFEPLLAEWIDQIGHEVAKATLSICAVIDFEAVLIDGAFPAWVRERIVTSAREYLQTFDARGLIVPDIQNGSIGEPAKALGAASGPIFNEFFLKSSLSQPRV